MSKTKTVIPAQAKARISIRFNDLHSGASLSETVGAIAEKHRGNARSCSISFRRFREERCRFF